MVIVFNDSGDSAYSEDYQRVAEGLSIEKHVTIVDHAENVGYPGAFLELFRLCETEYIFLTADDDLLDFSGVAELFQFLRTTQPDICSTQWLRDGVIHRGQAETRKATPQEFRALNGHAPGVIYNVSGVARGLKRLASILDLKDSLALTYPQLVLTIDAMLTDGNCWFFAQSLSREGDALPSHIKDASGSHYASLASRIQQLAALDAFILSYPDSSAREELLKAARTNSLNRLIKLDPYIKQNIESSLCGERDRSVLGSLRSRLGNFTAKPEK